MPQRMAFVGASAFDDRSDQLHLILQPSPPDTNRPLGRWKLVLAQAFHENHKWMPLTVRIWAVDEAIALLQGPFADTVTLAGVHPDHRAFPEYRATQWMNVEREIYATPPEYPAFAMMSSEATYPTYPSPMQFLPLELNRYIYRFVDKSKIKRKYTDAALALPVPPSPPPRGPQTPDTDVYSMFLEMGLPEDVAATHARQLVAHSPFDNNFATRNHLWHELSTPERAHVVADLVDVVGDQLAVQIDSFLMG